MIYIFDSATGTSTPVDPTDDGLPTPLQVATLRSWWNSWDVLADTYGSVPGVIPNTATTTQSLTADALYLSFWFLSEPIRVTALNMNVNTGAGTVLRWAILKMAGKDSVVVDSIIDQGTVDPSTTGHKTVSGLSHDLDSGLYASALVCDGAATMRVCRGFEALQRIWRLDSGTSQRRLPRKTGVGTGVLALPLDLTTSMVASGDGNILGTQMMTFVWEPQP